MDVSESSDDFPVGEIPSQGGGEETCASQEAIVSHLQSHPSVSCFVIGCQSHVCFVSGFLIRICQ